MIIKDIYTEPTYDELKDALNTFLNPDSEDGGDEDTNTTTTSEGVAASTTPTTNTGTTSDKTTTTAKSDGVEDAFDKLFND